MTTTISDGTDDIVPRLVDGYEVEQTSGNVFHDIIGRADQDVSLRAAGLRTGSLALLFDVKADAWAARDILTGAAVFTLVDSDHGEIDMTFVLRSLSTVLEDRTRRIWILDLRFKEVAA